MKKTLLFLLTGFLILYISCVEELNFDRPTLAEFIVVDGILNYHPTADSNDLVVYLNISNTNSSRAIPLGGASMEVIVNNQTAYPLLEGKEGAYYLRNPEIFQSGAAYQLRFQIGENIYESSPEILPDSVKLGNAYAELNPSKSEAEAFEVFIDMEDPSNQKNFYRWLITQWEKKKYCVFCYR